MITKSKTKQMIQQEAKLLIAQGLPKQTIYEMLLAQYKYAKNVADAIKYLPSKSTLEKYGVWNHVFLALHVLLLSGIVFFSIINYDKSSFISFPLLELAFIYVIWRKQIEYYDILMLFGFIYMILFVTVIFYDKMVFELFMPFIALYIILLIILPFWLKRKLCPTPLVRNVPYTNSEGKQKLKLEYEFPE